MTIVEFIIEGVKLFEGNEELLGGLITMFGAGGTWVGKIFYNIKKAKDDLRQTLNKSEPKNEDLLEIAKRVGSKYGVRELEKLVKKLS